MNWPLFSRPSNPARALGALGIAEQRRRRLTTHAKIIARAQQLREELELPAHPQLQRGDD